MCVLFLTLKIVGSTFLHTSFDVQSNVYVGPLLVDLYVEMFRFLLSFLVTNVCFVFIFFYGHHRYRYHSLLISLIEL